MKLPVARRLDWGRSGTSDIQTARIANDRFRLQETALRQGRHGSNFGRGGRMSRWRHSICLECWIVLAPGCIPVVEFPQDQEWCCRCGRRHDSGIYVRGDPAEFACGGEHEEE